MTSSCSHLTLSVFQKYGYNLRPNTTTSVKHVWPNHLQVSITSLNNTVVYSVHIYCFLPQAISSNCVTFKKTINTLNMLIIASPPMIHGKQRVLLKSVTTWISAYIYKFPNDVMIHPYLNFKSQQLNCH